MKAANLPGEMKRNLLDQVRRQIGDSNYDRAVAEFGEDQFLDLCLERAASATEPAPTACWGRWLRGGLWWIAIPTVVYLAGGEKACSDVFMFGFAIIAPYVVGLVWHWISESFKSLMPRL